jgi:hypothetical protein
MPEPLAIYLSDHLGGAQIAIHLLEAMRDQNDEEYYRDFAKRLLPEIKADDEALRGILASIDKKASTLKNAGGWLLEKLTRLKLGHTRSAGFQMFESIEILSLGIAGKRSLWKALQALSEIDQRLRQFDLARLLRRAEDQFEMVEHERIHLARHALLARSGTK